MPSRVTTTQREAESTLDADHEERSNQTMSHDSHNTSGAGEELCPHVAALIRDEEPLNDEEILEAFNSWETVHTR